MVSNIQMKYPKRCQFLMPNGVTITPRYEGSTIATISYHRITTEARVYVDLIVNARGEFSIVHNGVRSNPTMTFTAEEEQKAFKTWRAVGLLNEDTDCFLDPFAYLGVSDYGHGNGYGRNEWGLREHGSTVDTTSKIG
jgi:hypothetical protein